MGLGMLSESMSDAVVSNNSILAPRSSRKNKSASLRQKSNKNARWNTYAPWNQLRTNSIVMFCHSLLQEC
jgi:hypothetical protein